MGCMILSLEAVQLFICHHGHTKTFFFSINSCAVAVCKDSATVGHLPQKDARCLLDFFAKRWYKDETSTDGEHQQHLAMLSVDH